MMDFWFSQLETEDVKTSIRVNKQLYSAQSEYQRIDVFEKEYNEVYNIFPLWQDYLHKQNDDRTIREKILEDWILKLAEDLPCDTQE